MIISRTPFRISFFGGGTDFPVWYRENGGAVLSTTIDKYCYISCRLLPPFFEYRHRFVYSKAEQVDKVDEIVHPAIRETLRFMEIDDGLELHHDGDLPARTGLASSSAFTVGLTQALYALKGRMVPKKQLALDAIHIEQNLIRENVGSQDQVAVAFGGLNKISFSGEHDIEVAPVIITREKCRLFQDHLMLFFTGFARSASKIEEDKIGKVGQNGEILKEMYKMVGESIRILTEGSLEDFGRMLHENWRLKKSLSGKVSTNYIDYVYDMAVQNGAVGGKILGAGGGGFILFFVKPEDHERLRQALGFLLHVPFKFDFSGSQIIYYTGNGGAE
ncbi:MAG: kinase [Nitrospiraceae bacterium]|nr:MAG: kinase [Nitrospiraceae bacterium]